MEVDLTDQNKFIFGLLDDLLQRFEDMYFQNPSIKNARYMITKLSNEMKKIIYFDKDGFIYSLATRRQMKRVTNFLKETFNKDVEENPMKYDKKTRQQQYSREYLFPRVKSQFKKNTVGTESGLQVHGQVEKFVYLLPQFKRYKTGGIESIENPRWATFLILGKLYVEKLYPMISEFPIATDLADIATRIDLICFNVSTQNLVLVEIKTGREQENYHRNDLHDDLNVEGFKEFKQCPATRDHLQLLSMKAILSLTSDFADLFKEFYIIRSNERANEAYLAPLDPLMDKKLILMSTLMLTRKVKKEKTEK